MIFFNDKKGVVGVTVTDDGVWNDLVTGIAIRLDHPDSFHYTASRGGEIIFTTRFIDHGQGFTEFKIESQ